MCVLGSYRKVQKGVSTENIFLGILRFQNKKKKKKKTKLEFTDRLPGPQSCNLALSSIVMDVSLRLLWIFITLNMLKFSLF